jgi:hypothetical protein
MIPGSSIDMIGYLHQDQDPEQGEKRQRDKMDGLIPLFPFVKSGDPLVMLFGLVVGMFVPVGHPGLYIKDESCNRRYGAQDAKQNGEAEEHAGLF